MNIDFLPSAKSAASKLTTSGDTGSVTGKEGPDDSGEGFFAKLSALFKGDVQSESKVEKVQQSDVDTDVKSVDGQVVDQQAVDEVPDGLTTDAAAGEPVDGESQVPAKVSAGEEMPQPIDAQKVMGDGDKILSKLKDAHQALSKANLANQAENVALDGKELPSQTNAKPSAGQIAKHAGLSAGTDMADDKQTLPDTSVMQGSELIKPQSEAIAVSDRTLPSTQDSQPVAGDVQQEQSLSSSSSVVSAGVLDGKSADKSKESEDESGSLLFATAAVSPLIDQGVEVSAQDIKPETVSSDGEDGQMVLMADQGAVPRTMQADSQPLVGETEVVDPEFAAEPMHVTMSTAAAAAIAASGAGAGAVIETGDGQNEEGGEAQVVSPLQAEVTGKAAPDGEVLAKTILEAEALKSAGQEAKLFRHIHQSVQNPVQQSLNVPNMAERVTSPSTMPPVSGTVDLAAGSASAAVPVAASTIGAASLISDINSSSKASWSAARLEAGAAVARETDKARSGLDSGFAEQLSSLSGIQTQHNQLSRMESSQSQMPVMVTKDVAADQLAERVQVMLSKNLKNIDIRLDPPELGRMHIRMNMNGDAATVHFTVANQHARDALEGSMPRLREMLAQQGVQLGDTAVQHQGANQQQGYAAGGRAQSQSGSIVGGESGLHDDNFDSDVKLNLNVGVKRDGISYYA